MVFINDASVISLCVIFPVFSLAFVFLRFQARTRAKQPYGADDWVALVSTVLVVGCGVCFVAGWYSTEWASPNAATHMPWQAAFNMMSIVTIFFVKMTFALLYRRVFRHSISNVSIWIAIIATVIWTIAFIVIMCFVCASSFGVRPLIPVIIDGQVNPSCAATARSGHFQLYSGFVMVSMDLAIDLLLLAIPISEISRLRVRTKSKLFVIAAFGLGFFSIIATIYRLLAVLSLKPDLENALSWVLSLPPDNTTLAEFSYALILLTYLEIGFANMSSNLPPIVGLIRDSVKRSPKSSSAGRAEVRTPESVSTSKSAPQIESLDIDEDKSLTNFHIDVAYV